MVRKSSLPTRRDVAELAGVSETIVSYVMNNNRYVAADKRKRVLEAVEELHYRPNSVARALRGKGSRHILLITDYVENEYFGRLVHEIDTAAYEKGYLLSTLAVRSDEDFTSYIIFRQVDAVIIDATSLQEKYVQKLVDSGIPVVLSMNRDYNTITGNVGRVYSGIENGIMRGVRHLYETGCRHLVHINRVSSLNDSSSHDDLRFRGFCRQMEMLGLPLNEHSFIIGRYSYEQLFNLVLKRLESPEPVDGFVCRNDRMGATVLAALRAVGKRCPEDISVMGFDNSSISEFSYPALSTVQIDRARVAEAAINMIDAMLQGKPCEEIHFDTLFILRDTTRRI